MLKSRAKSRECLFMTSRSDETPEASLAPRSTYFKMTFYVRFCLGTRPNFEDEKNSASLCVDVCVVMETTQDLFWEKDEEKNIYGEIGERDPLSGEWRQNEGFPWQLCLTFQVNRQSCCSRYAGLYAVRALQTQSVIRWLSSWRCLVVQNGVVYHGSTWRWERGVRALWCPPVALFSIRRPDSGIITCIGT